MGQPITKIDGDELFATLRSMGAANMTTDDTDWIRRPGNNAALAAYIREMREKEERAKTTNPFEMTVEEQIAALRAANEEEKWGITEEQFKHLEVSAPSWPKGFDAFRSFRIRWGTGDDGVALTFERHADRFKRVHGDKAWRWELLLSAPSPYKGKVVKHLRLLGDKNASHVPVVEWITTDLQVNRNRTSVEAVRSEKSLADEGIVLGWLFPKRVEAIDYKKWCAWFCAGYELNAPENDDKSWYYVPCVRCNLRVDTRRLSASWRSNGNSEYSVPPLG